MATAALKGSARFEFTSITGMTSPFILATPLSPLPDFQVEQSEMRWVWRSMDKSTRNVVTVSATTVEVMAAIRFEDDPDRLRKFLRLAMDGDLANLVYKKTSGGGGISVTIDGVAGGTAVGIRPDRARGGLGEWETTIKMVLLESALGSLI